MLWNGSRILEYFPTFQHYLDFGIENSDVQFDTQHQPREFRWIIGGGSGKAATTVVALHPLALQHGAAVPGRQLE